MDRQLEQFTWRSARWLHLRGNDDLTVVCAPLSLHDLRSKVREVIRYYNTALYSDSARTSMSHAFFLAACVPSHPIRPFIHLSVQSPSCDVVQFTAPTFIICRLLLFQFSQANAILVKCCMANASRYCNMRESAAQRMQHICFCFLKAKCHHIYLVCDLLKTRQRHVLSIGLTIRPRQ